MESCFVSPLSVVFATSGFAIHSFGTTDHHFQEILQSLSQRQTSAELRCLPARLGSCSYLRSSELFYSFGHHLPWWNRITATTPSQITLANYSHITSWTIAPDPRSTKTSKQQNSKTIFINFRSDLPSAQLWISNQVWTCLNLTRKRLRMTQTRKSLNWPKESLQKFTHLWLVSSELWI